MYNKIYLMALAGLFYSSLIVGQAAISFTEALDLTRNQNFQIEISKKAIEQQAALIQGQVPVDKTQFFYQYDRNNIAENGRAIHVVGAGRNFKMPGLYNSYKKAQESSVVVQEKSLSVGLYLLEKRLAQIFEDYAYLQILENHYLQLDSIYQNFIEQAEKNLDLGGGTIMEVLTARQKKESLQLSLKDISHEKLVLSGEFRRILQTEEEVNPRIEAYVLLVPFDTDLEDHPLIAMSKSQITKAQLFRQARYNERLPEVNVSLFGGMNSFRDIDIYPGIEVGISVSLSNGFYKSRNQADVIEQEIQETKLQAVSFNLTQHKKNLESRMNNISSSLVDYNNLKLSADLLMSSADQAIQGGEIDYFQYLITLENTLQTRLHRLELIHRYNNTVIEYNYLFNND